MIVFLMIHVGLVIALVRRVVLVLMGRRGTGLDFGSPLSSSGEGGLGETGKPLRSLHVFVVLRVCGMCVSVVRVALDHADKHFKQSLRLVCHLTTA